MKDMMKKIVRIVRVLTLSLALLALGVGTVLAQSSLSIDIYGPGQSQVNLVMAQPLGLSGAPLPAQGPKLQDLINKALAVLPFLKVHPGNEILGGDSLTGVTAPDIDFKRFRLGQIDLLVTSGWKPGAGGLSDVEMRAYEVYTQRLVLGRAYENVKDSDLQAVAIRFVADLMEALTGQGDFFLASLAFEKRQGKNKEIWTVGPMGNNLHALTRLGALALSPSWSADGSKLVFTYNDGQRHNLGLLDVGSGQVRKIHLPGDIVISPNFMPNGRVAVALNLQGSSDIYMLNESMTKVDRPLAQSWAIDVSPSFDRSGTKMAFVSSRLGGPQIFLADLAAGGSVQRMTFEGNYNTNPALSPDGTLLAFARMTGQGHRIFMQDLTTGQEKQLTFGPGNDEKPAWAPDGYFLAFTSSRAGGYKIYITTRHGDAPFLVPTGDGEATAPSWRAGKK